jgi:hypothetical protein
MRQPISRLKLACVVWLGCITCTGCNPTHVELAGSVQIDGSPITQGTIRFAPEDPKGVTAEALIENGRYIVKVEKGNKKVMIHGFKKVGEQFPWGPNGRAADILDEVVPKEFNDETTLTIDVERSRSDADFNLSTKSNK